MQEKKIMDAIKAEAMQKVICRYSRLLWSIVVMLSQVGTPGDMEECVADVFVDLWEHPQKYDESRGCLKAWLSVIARNKVIDRYHQKTKIQTISLEETALVGKIDIEPEKKKSEGLQATLAELTEADLLGKEVEENLTFYFQKSAKEKYQWTALEKACQQAYENLPEFRKGQVVSAVSSVLLGNRTQTEMC